MLRIKSAPDGNRTRDLELRKLAGNLPEGLHKLGRVHRIRHGVAGDFVSSQIFVDLVQLRRALHFGFGYERGFSAPHFI
jgi:hypothetical protein